MGLPMFPRPIKPTGVLEAIDRDNTERKIKKNQARKKERKKETKSLVVELKNVRRFV